MQHSIQNITMCHGLGTGDLQTTALITMQVSIHIVAMFLGTSFSSGPGTLTYSPDIVMLIQL